MFTMTYSMLPKTDILSDDMFNMADDIRDFVRTLIVFCGDQFFQPCDRAAFSACDVLRHFPHGMIQRSSSNINSPPLSSTPLL